VYYRRLKYLAVLLAAAVLVVVGKLGYLQIARGDYYRGRAASISLRERLLPTSRGTIRDRRGKPLAQDEPSFAVYVRLDRLDNLESPVPYLSKLAELLGAEPEDLDTDLTGCREAVEKRVKRVPEKRKKVERRYLLSRFQLLRPNLSFERMAVLESRREELVELAQAGSSSSSRRRPRPIVELRAGMRRVYPAKESACHLVGYLSLPNEKVDWRELAREHEELKKKYHLEPEAYEEEYLRSLMLGDLVGASGLEKQYESELRGRRGLVRELVNASGARQETLYSCEPVPGADVHLTLDLDIQGIAETALGDNPGAVVILQPEDGAVLALASYPRFDPKTFQKVLDSPHRPLINRTLQEYYQPGSVFKVIGASAALETAEALINPLTSFNCEGSMLIGNRIFHCWRTHGAVELRQALEQSCNVYFFNAARKTGPEELLRWAGLFGLGEPTGVDLPYEKPGSLPIVTTAGDLANLAIGQGAIQVTPLQIARMMAAIANGGYLVQPHLRRNASSGPLRKLPLRRENLDAIREGLRAVVGSRQGTGWQAHVEGLSAAGKTGTAQTGRKDQHHAWFVGYAPYQRPKMVLAIVVENTSGGGGDTAAPIAAEVFRQVTSRGLLD
jgi:penicillin-binding protein 2